MNFVGEVWKIINQSNFYFNVTKMQKTNLNI